ncbi:MAG TPA: acetyl-CoA carboxylase carboxyltransferase subunit alpha [Candidatus Caenarcaniphilales bacterium]|nr:acetyl-CoA carboxylase carboxyltransferase subunit alpha [Candidatus Caenarcaniphilales bacterium]
MADVLDTPVDLVPVDTETLRAAVWTRVQLARNVKRPHTLELVRAMATDVIELHGDRLFRDDLALVGGFCRIDGRRAVFVGHQKGAETDENIRRNFGMPHPEGYRKAMRLFRLAERLRLPVVTFVDTPGAFPGPASEERGVAEAIARSIQLMTGLRTPIVTVITGEGGSGGALAIAVGDVVLALENAIYSVISPEGCASILWRSPDRAQDAAVAMRLTAGEQQALGVIDEVVPEPGNGAHENLEQTARALRDRLVVHLDTLAGRDRQVLVNARYARYRRMGEFATVAPAQATRPERHRLADRIRALLQSGRAALAGADGSQLRSQVAAAEDEPPLREEV